MDLEGITADKLLQISSEFQARLAKGALKQDEKVIMQLLASTASSAPTSHSPPGRLLNAVG